MTIRTRLAVAVILILVGWFFAAPHSPSSSVASIGLESATPALQIQRAQLEPRLDVVDVQGSDSANFLPQAARRPSDRTRFSTDYDEPEPFPALKLPPPIAADPASLAPISINTAPASRQSQQSRQSLKPVSLVGTDIGSDATWIRHSPSQPDSEPPAETRRHQEMVPVTKPADTHEQPLSNTDELPSIATRKRVTRWHRIVNGDTLEGLSSRYYGTPAFKLLIFEANRHALMSPNVLPIGVDLVIPDPSAMTLKRAPRSFPTERRPTVNRLQPQPIDNQQGRIQRGWQSVDSVD